MNAQEQEQRQGVVDEALTWLRTPHHHRGRLKGVGVDCLTFPAMVYQAVGLVPLLPELEYSEQWFLHKSEEIVLIWVVKYGREIKGPPLPGDLVLYQYGHCFSHGGIVLDWPQIIHAIYHRAVEFDDGEHLVINGHRPKQRKFYRYQGWD